MTILSSDTDNRHLRLSVSNETRVIVIGDLHGEISQLNNLLDKLRFDCEKDLLISTGDLIDRGENSYVCLDKFMNTPNYFAVLGNHEQLAIDALKNNDFGLWYLNGGEWFDELPTHKKKLVIQYFDLLDHKGLYTICLEKNDKRFVIAHADIPNQYYRFGQTYSAEQIQYLLWNRQSVHKMAKGIEISYHGADQFIFGHTPQKEIMNFGNVTLIDTGACFHAYFSKLSYLEI
ncbi:metallophosphoesterase [Thorsellia anophelis]|uniref:Serine/threonine protein phosphatase 1 n=1 Tax=Thorsellia anophelis DSM 18579 TaxID=1123402 RepID=A0A1I0D367_9GAMM|nr:metallophosphoesterase [Thorsellia anophelis]SET26047.1 serine/threonine protein phosphatase 1 [Thorsellia anophelis DSM 18579]